MGRLELLRQETSVVDIDRQPQTFEFAVNYSGAAAELLSEGRIQVDRFKCPAWPDLIAAVGKIHPIYVHFPLRIGAGTGTAIDTETQEPVDWQQIESLLNATGTSHVNVHLAPLVSDFDQIPVDSLERQHRATLLRAMLRDARAVVEAFGPERVLIENADDGSGQILHGALLPEIIHQVVEEVGCGFLLDISHARLAARALDLDAHEYLTRLPTGHTCEIHLAGIQPLAGRWLRLLHQAGLDQKRRKWFSGPLLDHLPLTEQDWRFYTQSLQQLRAGAWGQPHIVTFEYGGVGHLWELFTDKAILGEQIPRLRTLVLENQFRKGEENT
jgi:uncharacterized protein (UPF0276 family)